MSVKERILMIRLMEKGERSPAFAKKLLVITDCSGESGAE